MSGITIESLGITEEELQQRVVERIAGLAMTKIVEGYDYDDEQVFRYDGASALSKDLDKLIKEKIDAKVNEIADAHVLPGVESMVENLTLQETNRWGEKVGEPVTFIEYLIHRAENYMTEKVDYNGKSKSEAGSYSWSGTQTRVSHLVEKHLHYSIENAMKAAVKNANDVIVKGLNETVKIKLKEVADGLKVNVKTR